MRRRWLWATISFGAACALAAACGGDDSSTPESTNDASANDATSSDAGAGEAAANDAGDAGPQTVTVFAGFPGSPVAGAIVVFYDPSGNPSAPMTTGADGTVTKIVAPGSSVTAAVRTSNDLALTSFIGIDNGDYLVAFPGVGAKEAALGHVSLPAPTGDAGTASEWDFDIGCGAAPTPVGSSLSITVGSGCLVGGHINAMAWSRTLGNYFAYASAGDIPFLDGGGSLSAWSWSPAVQTPITTTGAIDPSATNFRADVVVRAGALTYAGQLDEPAILPGDGGGPGNLSVGLPGPVTFLDNMVSTAKIFFPNDSAGNTNTSEIGSVDSTTDPITFDLTTMPPHLHDGSVTFDSGTSAVTASWTADGAVTSLVGNATLVGWTYAPSDGGTTLHYEWTIVGPSGTSVVSPKLTTELAPNLPGSIDTSALVFGFVYAQGGSLVPSYTSFRNHYADYTDPSAFPPAHGSVVMTSINY